LYIRILYHTIFCICVFINLNIQIVPHATVLFACIGWLYYSFDNRELYLDIILDNRVSVMPKRSVFRLPKWSRTCILRRGEVPAAWTLRLASQQMARVPRNVSHGHFAQASWMDHLHYRLNFDLGKNFITAWKSITKLVIFQSFVAKCCKMRII
jgi:hypothetical protein